jgi:hypothetical protein
LKLSQKLAVSTAFLGLLLFANAFPCRAQVTLPQDSVDSPGNTGGNSSSLLTTAQPPSAGLAAATPAPQTDGTEDSSGWHFTVSPYLWFPGVHGEIGDHGRETDIHASAGDLLSHFRFGLMGTVEPRYKRVVMPLDVVWVRLGDDRALTNLATVANLKGSEFILTQKIGYRVIDTKMVKIDALAGFRYWHYGQSVSFTTNTLNFSSSQNWVDPLVGGRITGNLSPKVSVIVAGDVGGWGVGSQLDYQIVGLLGYRIKPALALQAGYRYLAVNYTNGASFVDIVTSGVVFGVSIALK